MISFLRFGNKSIKEEKDPTAGGSKRKTRRFKRLKQIRRLNKKTKSNTKTKSRSRSK